MIKIHRKMFTANISVAHATPLLHHQQFTGLWSRQLDENVNRVHVIVILWFMRWWTNFVLSFASFAIFGFFFFELFSIINLSENKLNRRLLMSEWFFYRISKRKGVILFDKHEESFAHFPRSCPTMEFSFHRKLT